MISVTVKDYKVACPYSCTCIICICTCIKSGSARSSNFRVKFSKQNLTTEPRQKCSKIQANQERHKDTKTQKKFLQTKE